MSVNTVEQVLYELGTSRRSAEKFKSDEDEFLARYRLSDAEKEMFKTGDVAGMRTLGANPMLLVGFWMITRGPKEMGAYMKQMKTLAE